jgi:hypothetical protein
MHVVRKFWGSLLLVLSLLVSQQGALLHELSHLADASRTSTQPAEGKSHAPGTLCETCLAFDHIAGVIHGSSVAPALLATADHWVGDERFAAGDADVPAHSARDPPIVL